MSFHLELFVAGLPRAQPRAQRGKGGHIISATSDDPIHLWRHGVRYEAQRAMAGRTPYLDAIRMDICFLMPRPKRLMSDALEAIPHVRDPDFDNLVKAAMDALKMVVYADDNQVSCAFIRKRYVTGPEAPGAYLRFTHDKPVWSEDLWNRIKSLLAR